MISRAEKFPLQRARRSVGRTRGRTAADVVCTQPTDDPPETYPAFLADLKQRIKTARLQASLSINKALLLLYWSIGHDILTRQNNEGWGAKVIDRLGTDLRRAFPEMTGISPRSLKYMRAFAEAWPDETIVQQLLHNCPWGHIMHLLDAVKCPTQREWYARQTIEHGWSRSVLVHQIESRLFDRQGGALTNFERTLPAEQSELAQQLIKDPYSFDFLCLAPEARERAIERGLIQQVRSLILELGKGFAFVGSQYPLEVGGQDFYLDLLFYHLRLRCGAHFARAFRKQYGIAPRQYRHRHRPATFSAAPRSPASRPQRAPP
jgi:predicted nuclease of restriction endonuclease-like (RecB) superfamily